MQGEPTQYLTGVKEFYDRPFAVDARVLVPRPETELLVERVLRALPEDAPARALDLCTGSGCIAVTLAAERPKLEVLATDFSPDALAVARANAERHAVSDRVRFVEGDLFAAVDPALRFDAIATNPPYIATAEIATLSAEVRKEPRGALDGGPDGLVLIRKIAAEALGRLVPGGLLAIEIGETQGPAVLALLQQHGYAEAAIEKDLERRERFAVGRARPDGIGFVVGVGAGDVPAVAVAEAVVRCRPGDRTRLPAPERRRSPSARRV